MAWERERANVLNARIWSGATCALDVSWTTKSVLRPGSHRRPRDCILEEHVHEAGKRWD